MLPSLFKFHANTQTDNELTNQLEFDLIHPSIKNAIVLIWLMTRKSFIIFKPHFLRHDSFLKYIQKCHSRADMSYKVSALFASLSELPSKTPASLQKVEHTALPNTFPGKMNQMGTTEVVFLIVPA